MYAVFETGGQQFRVKEGQIIEVQKLTGDTGETHCFDKVLLLSDGQSCQVGQPLVAGATVEASVLEQKRGEKIEVIKFRRRKHSQTRQGHRQYLTRLKITAIVAPAHAKGANP